MTMPRAEFERIWAEARERGEEAAICCRIEDVPSWTPGSLMAGLLAAPRPEPEPEADAEP
jgi:hypothetical protein